jgi:hypothetical protein
MDFWLAKMVKTERSTIQNASQDTQVHFVKLVQLVTTSMIILSLNVLHASINLPFLVIKKGLSKLLSVLTSVIII